MYMLYIMRVYTAEVDKKLVKATKETPMYTLAGQEVYAKCVDVSDGDTAQFVFRVASNQPLYRYSCRMTGYNSAEIKGGSEEEKEQARASKQALSEQILGKVVVLSVGTFDKYGRLLVTVRSGEQNINKWMIEHGYGKPYMGHGEKQW